MALPPTQLEDYAMAGPLGSGATSRVFAATHIQTGRAVAIKMLEPSARGSHELKKRLEREATVLQGVHSPHVGRLLGVGWESGQPFLVLERLKGETLADVIKREGTIGIRPLIDWIEQLLLGVRDIHEAQVIHRDIKPANIFLVGDGGSDALVKLIDFGVARLKEIALDGASLTSTHHLIGSMGYMAPEQLEYAKGVGPPADLYAVGVVVFRGLTGRLPFMGRSFEALQRLKVETDAPLLSSMMGTRPVEALDAFVAQALVRDPAGRFSSAKEMLEAWWRVASAIDRDPRIAPLPSPLPASPTDPGVSAEMAEIAEYDVMFEDSSTLVEHEITSNRNTAKMVAAPIHLDSVTAAQSGEVQALIDAERQVARRRREQG